MAQIRFSRNIDPWAPMKREIKRPRNIPPDLKAVKPAVPTMGELLAKDPRLARERYQISPGAMREAGRLTGIARRAYAPPIPATPRGREAWQETYGGVEAPRISPYEVASSKLGLPISAPMFAKETADVTASELAAARSRAEIPEVGPRAELKTRDIRQPLDIKLAEEQRRAEEFEQMQPLEAERAEVEIQQLRKEIDQTSLDDVDKAELDLRTNTMERYAVEAAKARELGQAEVAANYAELLEAEKQGAYDILDRARGAPAAPPTETEGMAPPPSALSEADIMRSSAGAYAPGAIAQRAGVVQPAVVAILENSGLGNYMQREGQEPITELSVEQIEILIQAVKRAMSMATTDEVKNGVIAQIQTQSWYPQLLEYAKTGALGNIFWGWPSTYARPGKARELTGLLE